MQNQDVVYRNTRKSSNSFPWMLRSKFCQNVKSGAKNCALSRQFTFPFDISDRTLFGLCTNLGPAYFFPFMVSDLAKPFYVNPEKIAKSTWKISISGFYKSWLWFSTSMNSQSNCLWKDNFTTRNVNSKLLEWINIFIAWIDIKNRKFHERKGNLEAGHDHIECSNNIRSDTCKCEPMWTLCRSWARLRI